MGLLGEWPTGRVDQIAILTPDLNAAMDGYAATLDVSFQVFEVNETNSSFSGSGGQFRTRIAVAQAGLTSIELIQPVSGDTLHSRHLKERGPGLHHLATYVADLAEAVEALRGRGYRQLLEGKIHGLGDFAYFDAPDLHCIFEPLHLSIEFPVFLAQHATCYP